MRRCLGRFEDVSGLMLAFGVPAGLGDLLRGLGVESHGLQSNAHWGVVRAHRALTGGSDIMQNHPHRGRVGVCRGYSRRRVRSASGMRSSLCGSPCAAAGGARGPS